MPVFFTASNAANVFTIVSNFILLLPAVVGWNRGRKLIGIIFFVETWISSLYHLCKAFDVCVLSYQSLEYFDFFFATSFVWQAVVFLIYFPKRYYGWELFTNLAGLLTIAIVLAASSPGSSLAISIFTAVAISIFIVYLAGYACARHANGHDDRWLPPYDWEVLYIAVVLVSLSTMMFVVQNYYPGGYWATHSIWHMMASLGWTWLLFTRATRADEWAIEQANPSIGFIRRVILPVHGIKGH